MTTTTATITLRGETREVEIELPRYEGGRARVQDLVVATIGAGSARYPDALELWARKPGEATPSGHTRVVAADGSEWSFHLGTCIRNRQARIVGWADSLGVTNAHSQERAR